MTSRMRLARQPRGLLLLGVCLLLLGMLPARPTLAAFRDQTIDNTLTEFATGTFQRSSLGAVNIPSIPNQKLADQTGAVQLGPIGLLRNWKKLPTGLPSQLSAMGTAAIGSRMYIIGGLKSLGGRSAEVWSAGINTTSGALLDPGWQAEPSLTPVRGSDDIPAGTLVAERASPAIAAINKSNGGGYIYVIGGTTFQGTRDLSSYSVLRGDVGADGRMAGPWVELPAAAQIPLPDPADPFFHPGLTQAAAVPFTTTSGRTFIYLIGGLQKYLSGPNLTEQGSRQTWYTEVNVSNGALSNPAGGTSSVWAQLDPIPLPDPPEVPLNGGLWNTVAVADHFLTSIGGFTDALYVIGGQTTPGTSTASQAVYRGLIASDGKLTWTTNAGPDIWQGTLPQARAGHGGALFRGNVYLTSGQRASDINPDTSVLTTYVEDNLRLHNFGALGVGSDFLESPDALSTANNGPGTPRTTHGTILVPAGPQAPNAAFIYIVGGRGDLSDGNNLDDQGSADIVMAKIGADEDVKNNGYAPSGLYYSSIYPITFDQAEVRQISWATQITTTATPMDIAIDYRVSNDANCSSPSWTDASWQPLDGSADPTFRSIDGQNIVDITSVPAHCFQYRALLTSSSDLKQTPSLLNVSIRIFVPGSPDLSVKTLTDRRGANNSFTGLNVVIQNVNQLAPPTLSADVEGGGSFSVDLCIYGPNATGGPPTLPLSPSNKQCSKAFANVAKNVLGPDAAYPITRWFDTNTEQPVELITYFQQPGTYTIYAAVDSFVGDATQFPRGFVDEGDQGEGNNVSAPLTIQVQAVGRAVYLAQMRR